jgi:hypothetical protein
MKHYLDNVKKELEAKAAQAQQAGELITPEEEQAEETDDVVFGGDEESHVETGTGHEERATG